MGGKERHGRLAAKLRKMPKKRRETASARIQGILKRLEQEKAKVMRALIDSHNVFLQMRDWESYTKHLGRDIGIMRAEIRYLHSERNYLVKLIDLGRLYGDLINVTPGEISQARENLGKINHRLGESFTKLTYLSKQLQIRKRHWHESFEILSHEINLKPESRGILRRLLKNLRTVKNRASKRTRELETLIEAELRSHYERRLPRKAYDARVRAMKQEMLEEKLEVAKRQQRLWLFLSGQAQKHA